MDEELKIALCDLRHNTIGRHSVYVPIGIGYIASFLFSQFKKGSIALRLYTEPNQLSEDIEQWRPDIIGLSNYCWNSELSYNMITFAKNIRSEILCVMGGPEFPTKIEECQQYLAEKPETDIYVYDHSNGELSFAELVKAFCESGHDVERLRSNPINGSMSINPKTGKAVFGQSNRIIKDRDIIPSPYLSGLLDRWLTEDYVPSLETMRGCPFKCAYCHTGNNMNALAAFSVQRIKDEIAYIAKKIEGLNNNRLALFDSNFGMTMRDMEIAEYIAELMDKYDWPMFIEASTSKENNDRVLAITKILKNRMRYGLSRQTLNPITEKIINRKNIPLKRYLEIAIELKKRGQKPIVCESIVPMPEETMDSYLEGQKILMNAGINSGSTYTTMMLKGTIIASGGFRNRYKMKTKYRILPRQFGEYNGKKVFEVEEVCIETNTISFNEYRDIRGFSLLVEALCSEQLDIIHRHLKDLDLSLFEFIFDIWKTIKNEHCSLSEVYKNYAKEVAGELYDSPKGIYDFFCKPEYYSKLIEGELGDNLIRKYVAKIFFVDWAQLLDFLYERLKKMSGERISQNVAESLDAAKQWASVVMNIKKVLVDESIVDRVETMSLPYDVFSWYMDESCTPLTNYKNHVQYKVYYDKNYVLSLFSQLKSLHKSEDPEYILGNMFWRNWKVRDLWGFCKLI